MLTACGGHHLHQALLTATQTLGISHFKDPPPKESSACLCTCYPLILMSLGSSMLLQYQGFIFSWIDSTLPYPLIHCRTTQMTPSRTLNQAALNRAQTALPDGSSLWIWPPSSRIAGSHGSCFKKTLYTVSHNSCSRLHFVMSLPAHLYPNRSVVPH